MAAAAEADFLDGLSAEKIMRHSKKSYTKAEMEYAELEMNSYIV